MDNFNQMMLSVHVENRPVKNEIKPIPAPAEKIAQTIFFAADKKIVKPEK